MSLIDRLPTIKGSYRENADLSKTNWFGVGGPAEILFRPHDLDDLILFLKNKPTDIAVTILGVGSNLLIRDGGLDGVIIKLGRAFTSIEQINDELHVGTACLDYNVAMYCKENSLAGLEFLSGIPGCIGGAVAMNAGAYGNDTASMLLKAEAIDEQGSFFTLTPQDIGFIYRGNTMPEGWIFTKAIFKVTPGNQEEISAKINDICSRREASQPIRTKTSGSTFMNPAGEKRAWQLIDEAGCRGLRIGGAVVSAKHCNFLVNEGNATASDLEQLGEEVRRRVREKFNIELEWEVKRIGKHLKP